MHGSEGEQELTGVEEESRVFRGESFLKLVNNSDNSSLLNKGIFISPTQFSWLRGTGKPEAVKYISDPSKSKRLGKLSPLGIFIGLGGTIILIPFPFEDFNVRLTTLLISFV